MKLTAREIRARERRRAKRHARKIEKLAGVNATACARARRLLESGRAFSSAELRSKLGRNYSTRLWELRTGRDGGPPLAIETKRTWTGVRWLCRYRALLT